MLKKPIIWPRAEKKALASQRSSFRVWVISCIPVFTFLFFVECHCCDGFIALDSCAGQVRGVTARQMSVGGNWQMEASISPLIRGFRSPPTDRVQLCNVVPASSHPVRFIKRSLIPRHNIINFVSGWTQWTSNLINFYHWMLEGRLNEINAQYFPGRQPTLGVGLDCWQVRRWLWVWPIMPCLDPSIIFSSKENKISGFEINHEHMSPCILGDFRIMKWKPGNTAKSLQGLPSRTQVSYDPYSTRVYLK